jgi:putative heme-binding domain-containing protein
MKALIGINFKALSETAQQDLLRTFEVAFFRMGSPDAATKTLVINYLNPNYPSKSPLQNRMFSKLLVFLEAPQAIEKTYALIKNNETFVDKDNETATASAELIMRNPQYGLDIARMLANVPPAQQTFYAMVLSSKKTGWTPAQSEQYFAWYKKAFGYKGGNSYVGFIDKARNLALKNVPKDKFAYYDKLSGGDMLSSNGNDIVSTYSPKGPGRGWQVNEAEAIVKDSLNNRDYERGKLIFSAVMCNRCHTIQGEGSDAGPDLTQLGTRFSTKDILEAIITPNAAISDQYAATVFVLKDGQSVVGRLANEDATTYHVSQNPFDTKTIIKVPKKNVVSKKYSTVSVMLPGLINGLNPEELKDLMAYLVSGGNQNHKLYTSKK